MEIKTGPEGYDQLMILKAVVAMRNAADRIAAIVDPRTSMPSHSDYMLTLMLRERADALNNLLKRWTDG